MRAGRSKVFCVRVSITAGLMVLSQHVPGGASGGAVAKNIGSMFAGASIALGAQADRANAIAIARIMDRDVMLMPVFRAFWLQPNAQSPVCIALVADYSVCRNT